MGKNIKLITALICPKHRYRLREINQAVKCTYPRKMTSPVFICPLCSNYYVNFNSIHDNKHIVVGTNRFVNVLKKRVIPESIKEYKSASATQPKKDNLISKKISNETAVSKVQSARKTEKTVNKPSASNYQDDETKKMEQKITEKRCFVYGFPKATRCMSCGFGLKKEKGVSKVNGKIKVCPTCGTIHMPYNTFIKNRTWKAINETEIPLIVNSIKKKEEQKKQEKTPQNKIVDKSGTNIRLSHEELLRMKKDKELKERLAGVFQTVHYGTQAHSTAKNRGSYSSQYMHSVNDGMINIPSIKTRAVKSIPTTRIEAKDFVVRRNTFKCRYNNHSLQDVQAVFTTISRMGNVNNITIPAGYCPSCDMYFIMDSTYKTIRNSGVPICKTMDDKTYKSLSENQLFSRWSQESILMQFGYSVSQTDDLSSVQRQKILAAIVDNGVLSKSDVISYINNFIDLRKNQKNSDGSMRYRVAIKRWTEDRDFITNYRTGTFKEVQIRRIITDK